MMGFNFFDPLGLIKKGTKALAATDIFGLSPAALANKAFFEDGNQKVGDAARTDENDAAIDANTRLKNYETLAQSIVEVGNSDADKTHLTYDEFKKGYETVLRSDLELGKAEFDALFLNDSDGGASANSGEVTNLFSVMDSHKNGTISYADFMHISKTTTERLKNGERPEDIYKQTQLQALNEETSTTSDFAEIEASLKGLGVEDISPRAYTKIPEAELKNGTADAVYNRLNEVNKTRKLEGEPEGASIANPERVKKYEEVAQKIFDAGNTDETKTHLTYQEFKKGFQSVMGSRVNMDENQFNALFLNGPKGSSATQGEVTNVLAMSDKSGNGNVSQLEFQNHTDMIQVDILKGKPAHDIYRDTHVAALKQEGATLKDRPELVESLNSIGADGHQFDDWNPNHSDLTPDAPASLPTGTPVTPAPPTFHPPMTEGNYPAGNDNRYWPAPSFSGRQLGLPVQDLSWAVDMLNKLFSGTTTPPPPTQESVWVPPVNEARVAPSTYSQTGLYNYMSINAF
jgi:Ca2+-binding EF-hand superfamily protein